MEAAWQILQLPQADDFIIATGEAHSVKEFVDEAFAAAGLNPEQYVSIDQSLVRPTKTSALIGNITKAKQAFNFDPQYKFKKLVKLMVESDIKAERGNLG
jgi:GDPmannose 4,6-dehydratase